MKGIFSWIVPNEVVFLHKLQAQSQNTLSGVETLVNFLKKHSVEGTGDLASLRGHQDKSDSMKQDLVTELNKALITPLDREDIYRLSMALDDIINDCENTARS